MMNGNQRQGSSLNYHDLILDAIFPAPFGFSVDHLLTSFVQMYCKLHHFRTKQTTRLLAWLLEP